MALTSVQIATLKKRIESKSIPEEIILTIEDVLEEQIEEPVKNPVTVLKKEFRAKELEYEPEYGEILKQALKLALIKNETAIQNDEDDLLLMLLAA